MDKTERELGSPVYYQTLDVLGKCPPSDFPRQIESIIELISMHPIGKLEKVVISEVEMFMQILTESHLYLQHWNNDEVVLSLASCRFFEEKVVLDYLQRENWEIYHASSRRRGKYVSGNSVQ